MKQAYHFDENGHFIDTVVLENHQLLPAYHTDIRPPDGLFQPTFQDGHWNEGMDANRIHELRNQQPRVTDIEMLLEEKEDLAQ
ncbi:hypothetical protein [Marinicrinis sediminis]|uniref:Uncharacterized protein n=1 Tax=Marinicrinis sediminis TaxID=1652465 RepID=A0ABW5R8S4_9BACL